MPSANRQPTGVDLPPDEGDNGDHQDQRPEKDPGDQPVHPLQHHLEIAVADIAQGGEVRRASAATRRSRSASPGQDSPELVERTQPPRMISP